MVLPTIRSGKEGRAFSTALCVYSRHLFRDFIDATASVTIGDSAIDVHFQKRAHNPLLLAAGFDQTQQRIPWLANKRLNLYFG